MGRGSLVKRWGICICSLLEQYGIPRAVITVECVNAYSPRSYLRFCFDTVYLKSNKVFVRRVLEELRENDAVVRKLDRYERRESLYIVPRHIPLLTLYLDIILPRNITPEACGWKG
jgi:hypothetical protein